MIKSVIFDWNGTLLADTNQSVETFNIICKQFGKTPITKSRFKNSVDIPVRNFYLENGFSAEELEKNGNEYQSIFHENYERLAKTARLRRGARHTLDWLLTAGVDMVLISNHTQSGVEEQVTRLGIDRFFSHIYANEKGNQVLIGRNKFHKMTSYLDRHTFKKNEVINVGDAPEEVHMAKEAGIISVAITDGFYATHRLRKEKPNYIITNFLKLIDIVKELNKT